MNIRETQDADTDTVLAVVGAAFGADEEQALVADLLADPTAEPRLSLLAIDGDRAVGHILFSRLTLAGDAPVDAALLAPLAVIPGRQGQGIGSRLVETGLAMLAERGTALVFVLGYPDYYGRFGFTPAGSRGFEAPYPIAAENADAWMVKTLGADASSAPRGRVACAQALRQRKYWVE